MKAFTISVTKKLGYLLAALVIIGAVLVVATRFYLPALDSHKPMFERWASRALKAPVTITKARFSWYRYQPEISLSDITLYSPKTKKATFHLKRLRLFISIPKSLWERKVILSGVMLSGAEINIQQTKSGELEARDLPMLKAAGGVTKELPGTKVDEMLGYLLSQPRIRLSDIDLHYYGFRGQKRFVTFKNIRFENNDDDHVVLARAILHQDIPTEVSLVVQGIGDVDAVDQMKVNGYLYFTGLSLSQWAKNISWHHWEIKNGLASAKIWFTWDKKALQQVQSVLQIYELQLQSEKNKALHTINRLSADLGWRQEHGQQIIAADDVLLDMQDHIWPVTSFYAVLAENASQQLMPKSISVGYFNITDVLAFLDSVPGVISTQQKTILDKLKPTGSIRNLRITLPNGLAKWHEGMLDAALSNVSIQPWHDLPSLKNFSGSFEVDQYGGRARIISKNLEVNYDKLFDKPIWFNQFNADLQLERKQDSWMLKAGSIKALNSDLDVDVNGYVKQEQNQPPYIDLHGNFAINNVRAISRYLPLKTFTPGLRKWLQYAFNTGHGRNGQVNVQGKLSDFPFSHGEGKFEIATDVHDVELKYAPDWPTVKHVDGRVLFSGSKVIVHVDKAETLGIDLGEVYAEIPKLDGDAPTMINVKVDGIQTTFKNGIHYVKRSPLNRTVGRVFKNLAVTGDLPLKLMLSVPLDKPENTHVNGAIKLSNAKVNLTPWKLHINEVDGLLTFSEDTVTAKALTAILFDKPIDVTVDSVKKGKSSFIRIGADYDMSLKDIEAWLKVPIANIATGNTKVKALVDVSFDKPVSIALTSDLVGVRVDLPQPYAKPVTKKIDFKAQIIAADTKPLRMRLNYGKLLGVAFEATTKRNKYQLLGATLSLGGAAAPWPKGKGLYIVGKLDKLDADSIKQYASQSTGSSYADLPLKEVDLTVKNMSVFGQELDHVRLDIKALSRHWDINIIDDDVVGEVVISKKMNSRGRIKARFKKIDLDVADDSHGALTGLDVKSLPAIDFSANNVILNDMLIGQVEFNLVPSSSGMTIRSLLINSPFMDLKAAGVWRGAKQSQRTQLKGVLTSKNVSGLLHDFNYPIKNFVASNGILKFDLNWPGVPFVPKLKRLSGSAVLDLGAGRIVDVGEENDAKMSFGRMLSIFSLQSIPRRLSLNFSDLVEKGYSFDYLRGHFKLKDGNVYTNDSKFDGPVAAIGITGRIGVKYNDVDLKLSVTPYVASSLPVAATIIGGPVAGLASLAVGSVVDAAVSSVATHRYIVKGAWDNPSWESEKPAKRPSSRRRR